MTSTGDGRERIAQVRAPAPGVVAGIGTVVLYFLLQLALGLGIGLTWGALRHGGGSGGALDTPDAGAMLVCATVLLAAATMAVLVRWRWGAWWRVSAPPGFGFVAARPGMWPLAVAAGVLVALGGGVLTQWLADGQAVRQDVTEMSLQASLAMRVVLAVLVTTVAPLVEELIFRGVLLSALLSRMRAVLAVPASALVFGVAHLADFGFAWHAIPALVGLGLVLAWLRLRSGSLWPAVVAHAVNNTLAVAGWFLLAG